MLGAPRKNYDGRASPRRGPGQIFSGERWNTVNSGGLRLYESAGVGSGRAERNLDSWGSPAGGGIFGSDRGWGETCLSCHVSLRHSSPLAESSVTLTPASGRLEHGFSLLQSGVAVRRLRCDQSRWRGSGEDGDMSQVWRDPAIAGAAQPTAASDAEWRNSGTGTLCSCQQ
ncbi:hypothetical protein AAFF_G00228430 [Aldrovandia affinis]|uniref:Uncharacterized protein n=1 Tax=Aldrovandia affinis TaxID=143900 RepID=A0AAD7SV86_9TELE|nr:hypothetical protein AAFF_G00228430 [Aldrovandia affinis]